MTRIPLLVVVLLLAGCAGGRGQIVRRVAAFEAAPAERAENAAVASGSKGREPDACGMAHQAPGPVRPNDLGAAEGAESDKLRKMAERWLRTRADSAQSPPLQQAVDDGFARSVEQVLRK